jgi:L-fuculose-phosphate aldolase
MLLENVRQEIIHFGKQLITSRLTTGSGGNLSVCDRERGLVAISASGLDYFAMTAEDIVVTDLEGQAVEGERKPSSELGFHLALYHARPDVAAVVHTHSVYATTIACLNWELPAVHYLVGFSGNKVPLCPYAPFGTQELAEKVVDSIGGYNALLMANHGLVTVGPTLARAFAAAEEIELVAQIYYQAKAIGEPVILSDAQMEVVLERFKSYGQK